MHSVIEHLQLMDVHVNVNDRANPWSLRAVCLVDRDGYERALDAEDKC